jgi:hypothetical protein
MNRAYDCKSLHKSTAFYGTVNQRVLARIFIFHYLQIIWQPEKNAELFHRAQFKQSKFHDSSPANEFEFY